MTISGSLDAGTGGDIDLESGSSLYGASGSYVRVAGNFYGDTGSNFDFLSGSSVDFQSGNILRLAGTLVGATGLDADYESGSTTTYEAGSEFNMSGEFDLLTGGAIDVESGASINVAGIVGIAGQLHITGAVDYYTASTLDFQSSSDVDFESGSTTTFDSGSEFNFAGECDFLSGATVDAEAGSLFTFNAGSTIDVNGGLTVASMTANTIETDALTLGGTDVTAEATRLDGKVASSFSTWTTGYVPLVVKIDTVAHGDTNTTFDGTTLNVPQNGLGTNDALRFNCGGTLTGGNAAAAFIIDIDGASIMTITQDAAAAGDWVATAVIVGSSVDAQMVAGALNVEGNLTTQADYATDTTDFSAGAVTVKTRMTSGNGGDTMTQEYCIIEFLDAP